MNPEQVIAWRDALTALPDQQFFDLMRLYLGAVKTPFNKQRLVEELSAFLRRAETKERIIGGLDQTDAALLSGIRLLPDPSREKLISLFSPRWSFPFIHDRLLNLEERLVIYRKGQGPDVRYHLVPLLEPVILPLTSSSLVFPAKYRADPVSGALTLDDLAQGALYSHFLHHREQLRVANGYRKKTLEQVSQLFPESGWDEKTIASLVDALQNLGLLVKDDSSLVCDTGRWKHFACLPLHERLSWIIAAARPDRPGREALALEAAAAHRFLSSVEGNAVYERAVLDSLAWFVRESAGGAGRMQRRGRLHHLLQGDAPPAVEPACSSDIVTVCSALGLLLPAGTGLWQRNERWLGDEESGGSLTVEASGAVTVMPGFSLSRLLPVLSCMDAGPIRTVARFSVDRSSCNAAFRLGYSGRDIAQLLETVSGHSLPSPILFSLEDWYSAYTSVSLHYGFVISVDEKTRVYFERNRHLSDLVRHTLAPGVYVLNAESEDEIRDAFAKASLDLGPSLSGGRQTASLPFPSLGQGTAFAPGSAAAVQPAPAGTGRAADSARSAALKRQEELEAALASMSMETDIREELQTRIRRGIILFASQLDPESVRPEKVEAKGMDFPGKVRLVESALSAGTLVEIVMDEKSGGMRYRGRPLETFKRSGEVLVRLELLPEGLDSGQIPGVQVSLGKAVMVRKIRPSIFQ